jgi:signal transduction histidine kinase
VEEEDFASMTAHAFGALLAVVDGNAQRLMSAAEKLSAEELRDRAQRIRGAVRGMLQLVDDLVGSSTAGTRRFRYEPAVTDLCVIVREVCELQRDLVPEARIHLQLGPGPVAVWGDATLLRQVFGNIVANAVRYSSGAADLTVRLGAVEETDVTVLIEDCGIGIPPHEKGSVFEPYYRCSNAAGIVGQGLGLYVVKKLLDLHGGTVALDARSEVAGTVCTVCLPRSVSVS